jgi:hypothetical protein
MAMKHYWCIALLVVPGILQAQGTGTTGAQVLQLTAGGRASALSGAYTGVSGDVESRL